MNFLGEYLAVKKDTFLGSYVGEPSKKLWKGFKNTLGGVKRFLTFEAHEVENADQLDKEFEAETKKPSTNEQITENIISENKRKTSNPPVPQSKDSNH